MVMPYSLAAPFCLEVVKTERLVAALGWKPGCAEDHRLKDGAPVADGTDLNMFKLLRVAN
jgi:hypothetical protein